MDDEYLKMFFDEAEEYIQSLNDNILTLEENPEDSEVINSIFRAAHSLKGMAATMGFDRLTSLTHRLENALDMIRNDELMLDAEMIDSLFAGLDLINDLVDDIKATGEEKTDVEEYVEELNAIIDTHRSGGISPPAENADDGSPGEQLTGSEKELKLDISAEDRAEIKKQRGAGENLLEIDIILSEDSQLKSVRSFMVLKKADELGYLVKSEPSRYEIENDDIEVGRELSLLLISSIETGEIEEEFCDIIDVDRAELARIELEESDGGQQQDSDEEEYDGDKDAEIEVSPTVRVDIDKLDNLMNMVGEMLINKTQLEGLDIDDEVFNDIIQQLDRVTMDLHHTVMQIRMVPIGGIFNRFPRLVRDLSRELDKEVELNIEGADTELDRSIIDELADPLVHIIRNAVDHGIEKPAVREEKGKPPTGHIDIQAYQKGSEIVIEIEDDGRGLNPDEIGEKALEQGLVTREELETMEDGEKLNFIFSPGFSTNEEASEVSGRGVGMDVVQSVVESLDGQVKIDSELDEGTNFTITLPLTLAITQALMVRIDRETFAIPLGAINETLTIAPGDIKTVRGQEVIVRREETIPVTEAARQLNLDIDYDRYRRWEEIPVVIVNSGDRMVGLMIDEFLNQQEIVIKSLGKYLLNVENISGATIVGDGDVALILDVRNIA